MKRELLELKQKLMQRFLDGAIDQTTYDRMMEEINAMAREEDMPQQGMIPVQFPISGMVYPQMTTDVPAVLPYSAPSENIPSASTSYMNPEIDPGSIKSLKPGDLLDIWWHYDVTEECIDAWRQAEVPLKLSLTLNSHVSDETLRMLANVKNIHDLNLTSTPVTDEGIRFLGALHDLEYLTLTSTEVEGKTLHYLEECRNLRELTATSTPFDDEAMETLNLFQNLELLRLDDTNVTDDGLLALNGLHQLQVLNIQGTIISDAGMEALLNLKTLWELYVGGTIPYKGLVYESPVTDAGTKFLKDLVELRILHLNDTQITDATMPFLKNMVELRELNLADTYVTDGALPTLRKLQELREIMVENTAVTISGIRKVFGSENSERFHGGRVGAWSKFGRFLISPWSRKN